MVLTLSGRKKLHNVCSMHAATFLQAATSSELSSAVSCGQVKSKDMPFSDD